MTVGTSYMLRMKFLQKLARTERLYEILAMVIGAIFGILLSIPIIQFVLSILA